MNVSQKNNELQSILDRIENDEQNELKDKIFNLLKFMPCILSRRLIILVCGPTGSGKSTLINLLAGFKMLPMGDQDTTLVPSLIGSTDNKFSIKIRDQQMGCAISDQSSSSEDEGQDFVQSLQKICKMTWGFFADLVGFGEHDSDEASPNLRFSADCLKERLIYQKEEPEWDKHCLKIFEQADPEKHSLLEIQLPMEWLEENCAILDLPGFHGTEGNDEDSSGRARKFCDQTNFWLRFSDVIVFLSEKTRIKATGSYKFLGNLNKPKIIWVNQSDRHNRIEKELSPEELRRSSRNEVIDFFRRNGVELAESEVLLATAKIDELKEEETSVRKFQDLAIADTCKGLEWIISEVKNKTSDPAFRQTRRESIVNDFVQCTEEKILRPEIDKLKQEITAFVTDAFTRNENQKDLPPRESHPLDYDLENLREKTGKARKAIEIISEWPQSVINFKELHPNNKPYQSIQLLVKNACEHNRPHLFREPLRSIRKLFNADVKSDSHYLRKIIKGFETHLNYWWSEFIFETSEEMPTEDLKVRIKGLSPPYRIPKTNELRDIMKDCDFNEHEMTDCVLENFELSIDYREKPNEIIGIVETLHNFCLAVDRFESLMNVKKDLIYWIKSQRN